MTKTLADVRAAWRKNPLERRISGLVTVYVIGNGVTVTSEYRPLKEFIAAWWVANRMDLRLAGWGDGLTREGELFVGLYPASNGMTQVRVRVRPASVSDEISYCTCDAFARYDTITYENYRFQ